MTDICISKLTIIGWDNGWGKMIYIYISKLTIIGWDNGLSPGLDQAIISTNAGILLIGT